VRQHLKDFRKSFDNLAPNEKTEALQCVLKDIIVHPEKIVLNIYEFPEFKRGSQNRTEWLPG
jgi:hypothetical protein